MELFLKTIFGVFWNEKRCAMCIEVCTKFALPLLFIPNAHWHTIYSPAWIRYTIVSVFQPFLQ